VYDEVVLEKSYPQTAMDRFDWDTEYIQSLIDALPDGYRAVFVLYAIEGFKHQEIAKLLDITESTSKSQLFKARRMLKEQLKKQNIIGYGTE
ncbi:MAG: sigma-70 family RNA polymerase sigma factor, partial [Pricia sp.]